MHVDVVCLEADCFQLSLASFLNDQSDVVLEHFEVEDLLIVFSLEQDHSLLHLRDWVDFSGLLNWQQVVCSL